MLYRFFSFVLILFTITIGTNTAQAENIELTLINDTDYSITPVVHAWKDKDSLEQEFPELGPWMKKKIRVDIPDEEHSLCVSGHVRHPDVVIQRRYGKDIHTLSFAPKHYRVSTLTSVNLKDTFSLIKTKQ